VLTDELKQLGQRLVDELSTDRSSTTQKWMAHYIAELMERAEKTNEPDVREKTQKACSDLILRLWDLEKEQAKIRIQGMVYARFDEVYKKRSGVDDLKKIIEHPELVDELEDQSSKDIVLFWLNDIEDDLLRLQIIGEAINSIERDAAIEELLKEADKFLQIYETTKRYLKDIWEQVEEINIENFDNIQSFVSIQLRKIQDIRNRLLAT